MVESRRPNIPKARPTIPEGDIESLKLQFAEILSAGQLTQGPYLASFEAEFAAQVGVAHAIGMNSGTAPMEIALRYWRVEGREVVVPTNTFVATANAVVLAGGIPVLADIDRQTLSSGLAEIRAKVSHRTAGVVVVHLAGLITPEIDSIRRFCKEQGLFLLEDSAHAHGARWRDLQAGAIGGAGSFSFYPTKVVTCGEGGMLTTDDEMLADFARSFRCHGIETGTGLQSMLGANYRLPETSAAVGLTQIRRLAEFVAERNRLADLYSSRLAAFPGVQIFDVPKDHLHAYYKFPVLLAPEYGRLRRS